jgi:RNA polymerase sigma-70 factor (ECF subfamily)
MAINVCLNKLGDEKRRTTRVFTTADLASFESAQRARTPEAGIDLERALATLPTGARTAFVLHDVEGYKHSEIAEMTGVAEGTVKAQLHRARKLLQAAMNK